MAYGETKINHPYWNEYIGNRNRDINDPLRKGAGITVGDPYKQPYIDRDDGFRYGVGPFIVEETLRRNEDLETEVNIME